MASISQPQTIRQAKPASIGQGKLSRWLVPSFFDLLFLSVPAWLFLSGGAGFSRLLLDGDTGWHIRLGEWILQNGRVPATDFFSFSKAGQPWFAWEWLSNVIYGLLMQAGGLKAILWWSAITFAIFAGIVFRQLIWQGANLFVALALTLLGVGVASMHLLARPHLYTLVFLAAAWWAIQADLQRHRRWIWLLAPAMILWTNLHGGWAGGVASLGVLAAGFAVEAWLGRRPWGVARRYAGLTAACLGASLLNPYGIQLHLHVFSYLRNDWIKNSVLEFQSPKFRGEAMLQFEALFLAGLLTAGLLLRKRRIAEGLLLLFWAHQSLASARHTLLFALLALPLIAEQIMHLWNQWVRRSARNSVPRILDSIAWDSEPALRHSSAWLVLAPLAVLAPAFNSLWPADFPVERFPVAINREYRDLLTSKRVLTNDDWADYLLFANYPRQRVFFDGRSDFYGKQLGTEYQKMMHGDYRWRELLDRHRIDVALLESDVALSSLLKQSPEWKLLRDTGREILFERRPAEKRMAVTLMDRAQTAE